MPDVKPPYILLNYGGIEVTLFDIQSGSPPRINIEMIPPKKTALGYDIELGYVFEKQHLFEFSAVYDDEIERKIDGIYHLYDQNRINKLDTKVLLIDKTRRFTETLPRTRAVAPYPDNDMVVDGSLCSYFAQFWVRFTKAPVYNVQNKTISLAFTETEVKVTPS